MTTAHEAFDGALWLLGGMPNISGVYWSLQTLQWFLFREDLSDPLYIYSSNGFSDVVHERDVSLLSSGISCWYRLRPPSDFSNVFVRFNRSLADDPDETRTWLSGAAWAVLRAIDITHIGIDPKEGVRGAWHVRSDKGYRVTASAIHTRSEDQLRQLMNTLVKDEPPAVCWFNRYFLEDWFLCDQVQKGLNASKSLIQTAVKVEVSHEEALPQDLRGMGQFRGLTGQQRRQAHVTAILNDMKTRTSTPRYK